MTEITVKCLEEARVSIEEKGVNCIPVSLSGELKVSAEAVEWLKSHHYQLKIAETFGPTGIAVLIYPAE